MKWRRALVCLTAVILLGVFVYTGLRTYLHHWVDRQLQATAAATPVLDDIRYARLKILLRPFRLEFQDVALKLAGGVDPLPVRRATLHQFQPGHPLPRRLALALEGIRIEDPHPAVAPLQASLRRLGMQHLDLDLGLRLEKSPGRANAWRGHAELDVRGGGILRLALAVDNLDDAAVWRALDNPDDWWRILPPVGIRAAAAEFEDGGLVDRILAAGGHGEAMTPPAARQYLRQAIETTAHREGILPLGRLLSEFIAAPVRIGYYTGNTEPVYLGRLLWSREVRTWCQALQVGGYRRPSPRRDPWMRAAVSTPGKPPPP